MPRTLPNTFRPQTPIGQAIANLGHALFSGPTQQDLADVQAERDLIAARTQAAQSLASQREAEAAAERAVAAGQGRIADLFAQIPGQTEAFNAFVGPRPADQPQTTEQFTNQALQQAQQQSVLEGVRSGIEGDTIADMLGQLMNAFGGSDADLIRLQGAGGNFIGENQAVSQADREGVREANAANDIAETLARVAATPLTESQFNAQTIANLPPEDQRLAALGSQAFGSPVERVADETSPSGVRLVPRAEAAGQPGVAPAAASRSEILPNAARKDAIDQINNARALTNTTNRLRQVITPSNFGAVGAFKGTIQNLAQQVSAFSDFVGLGQQIREEIVAIQSDVNPDLFDPSLPAQQFLINTLAYQVAKMNDPSGRLSDTDVRNAANSLQARGILSNQAAFEAVLDEIDAGSRLRQDAAQRILENDTSAPAQPSQSPGANRLRFDAQGNRIQ